ncbi:MAG: DUF3054 domain-containing protein [Anaerolineales bacterium]|nr:DUF3054 domain-containing protein [Anaerolineales bacterium]
MRGRIQPLVWVLLAGDILTIGMVTLLGFARHGELLSSGLRPLTTFVPYLVTWLLIAPFAGAYRLPEAVVSRQLWRPVVAAMAAAPFAAMLRSLILNTPVQPVFVLVLGLTGALGIFIWRLAFFWLQTRLRTADG